MYRQTILFILTLTTLLFYSCSDNPAGNSGGGGGNGGGGGGTASATADAGSGSDEVVGFEVTADGSGSSGSGSVSYSWSISAQPTNSQASLSGASSAAPSFIPDLPGEYTLSLEVTSEGETDTDEVTFSAIAKRLFVDANNGANGDTDGYLPGTPLKTISEALNIIGQNDSDDFLDIDTMRVAEGFYDDSNGESFPLDFRGPLIVKGDQSASRNDIHIQSPDVEGDPATYIGEGVTMRHLQIENGYTGGSFNGDPDAVFVLSGSDMNTSTVTLENVRIIMNAREGVGISTGNDMTVVWRGYNGNRSAFDGSNVGQAYQNRFNTFNATLNITDTDIFNSGEGGALEVDDVTNLTMNINNTVFKPGANLVNPYAIDLEDEVDLRFENSTITSRTELETGARFKYGIVMDNAQPGTNIDVINSTIKYTQWSAIFMRAAEVRVTNSVIEGVLTQESNVNLAYDAIRQLDGTLIVRGTTFRDINTSAIDIGGPNLPNSNNFVVDLGKAGDVGDNTFENVRGWDVQVSRSGEVQTEIQALGNSWSNGFTPRCSQDLNSYDTAEIYIADQGGSLRHSATGICN